jgi:sulfur relay (sulfurtransferase) complex TusBCD TusD component (DsrE family)
VSERYLLVQTQPETGRLLRDAAALRRAGHQVRIYLVQDAVHAALRGGDPAVPELVEAGCTVWVDDVSLAQRGLTAADLAPAPVPGSMAQLVPEMLDGSVRVVWR